MNGGNERSERRWMGTTEKGIIQAFLITLPFPNYHLLNGDVDRGKGKEKGMSWRKWDSLLAISISLSHLWFLEILSLFLFFFPISFLFISYLPCLSHLMFTDYWWNLRMRKDKENKIIKKGIRDMIKRKESKRDLQTNNNKKGNERYK